MLLYRRKNDLVFGRKQVEPLLGRKTGHMRQAEPDRKEERFAWRQCFHLGNRGLGNLPIRLLAVVLGKSAPVHRSHLGWRLHKLLVRQRHPRRRSPDVELVRVQPGRNGAVVKHLAECGGEIAVLREILRQRDAIPRPGHVADSRGQPVNAGGGRPQARQQAGARRIAQRRLAMRVLE